MILALYIIGLASLVGGLLFLLMRALDDRDQERARRMQAEWKLRALERELGEPL